MATTQAAAASCSTGVARAAGRSGQAAAPVARPAGQRIPAFSGLSKAQGFAAQVRQGAGRRWPVLAGGGVGRPTNAPLRCPLLQGVQCLRSQAARKAASRGQPAVVCMAGAAWGRCRGSESLQTISADDWWRPMDASVVATGARSPPVLPPPVPRC